MPKFILFTVSSLRLNYREVIFGHLLRFKSECYLGCLAGSGYIFIMLDSDIYEESSISTSAIDYKEAVEDVFSFGADYYEGIFSSFSEF